MKLLDGVTADGAGAAQQAATGTQTVFCYGTFGGGTCALEISPDEGTTWITLNDLEFTEAGAVNLHVAQDTFLRGNLTGSTSPDLTLELIV